MRTYHTEACCILLLAALLLPAAGHCQAYDKALIQFLQKYFEFGSADYAAMARGQAAVRVLKAGAPGEMAVFGMIYVNGSPEAFLARYRDIVRFKKSEEVLQIGTLGNPAQLSDIGSLRMDRDEVESLRDCTIGDCEIRLPASQIQRFRNEVRWSSPDAARQAEAIGREMLIDCANAYMRHGNDALVTYNDKKQPVSVSDQSAGILQQSTYLRDYVPEFYAHLLDYPRDDLQGVDDFLYWSNEKFGLKPVISLTHVSIYTPPHGSPAYAIIASKQIYATHYFDASLGLTALYRSGHGFFLMYLNRSRADSLKGGFLGAKRSIVQNRSREGMAKNLLRIKRESEQP